MPSLPLPADPRPAPALYCSGGKLVRKEQAPKCIDCGVRLWTPVRKPYAPATHDDQGRRLGIVKTYRWNASGKPVCWNGKACAARKAVSK